MSQYDTQARTYIQSLLNGKDMNGSTPAVAELGPWAEPAVAIREAFDLQGQAGARSAFNALILANRKLAELIAGDPDSRPLETISADEILDTSWPDPVWAIPGLLPEGLTILAGRPKLGKSWLVLQEARAVATGGVFLGQRIDQAGPVLYLALEDTPRRLQERMKKQGWPRGLPVEFVTMEQFKDKIGNLLAGGAERLAQQIADKRYHLVIIDTLSRACFDDQNKNDVMSQVLAPVQEIALRRGLAIQLVDHHSSHMVGGSMDAVGDIMGGTSKGATLDTAWGLYRERGKTDANLAVTGREVDEQNLSLTFNKLTGAWDYQGDYYTLKLTKARQEYIDVIEALNGSAQAPEVAKNLGISNQAARQSLQELVTGGYLERIEKGRLVFYELPNRKNAEY